MNHITRGWAIAVLAVLLLAVPAAAGVVVQNFMTADVTVSDACFTKAAGNDATTAGDFLTFDATNTVQDLDNGVSLLQEATTIRAFAGDRLLYSDAIVFGNDCGNTITLSLASGDDPAGNPAIDSSAVFTDQINVRFYLADPGGGAVVGLPGTWTEALSVVGGSATNGGSVTLADGGQVVMAIQVDADAEATSGALGTLRWVAQAEHN